MAASTSVDFQPAEATAVDVYITEPGRGAATSDPTSDDLHVGIATSGHKRILMKWDLTSLPTQSVVAEATLTLKYSAQTGMSSNQSGKLYRVTQDFEEDTTWTSRGGSLSNWSSDGGDYTTSGGVSFTMVSATDLVITGDEFTALVQDAIDNRSRYLLIILGHENDFSGGIVTNNVIEYHSSNAASSSNYPKLNVVYEAVTSWTGAAGDGNAGTSTNWTNGLPGANVRAVINATNQAITGAIEAHSVHFGPNFKGKWGTSSASRSSITTHKCVVNSKAAEIFVTFVQAGVYTTPTLYLANAPTKTSSSAFTGALIHIYMTNSTQTSVVEMSSSTTLHNAPKNQGKVSLSTDAEGAIYAGRQSDTHHIGTPAQVEAHNGAKVRVDGDDDETAGPISASQAATVDFRAATLTGKSYFATNGTIDCRSSNNTGVVFGADVHFLRNGVGLLYNGVNAADIADAVNMYGGYFIVDEGIQLQAETIASTY